MSDSLWHHRLQHTMLPCPSPTCRAYSNSCPSSQWCHSTISPSVVPFSFHLQSSPASESFPMSQFFASHGQSIGVSASASVLPMNIQDWFPLVRILDVKKIKSITVSIVSTSIFHEVMGPDAMILVFWMLNFKPAFLLLDLPLINSYTKRTSWSSEMEIIRGTLYQVP